MKTLGLFLLSFICVIAQTNVFPTSGGVGIGTTNPVHMLDITNNGTAKIKLLSNSVNHNAGILFYGSRGNGVNSGHYIGADGVGSYNLVLSADEGMFFKTNGIDRMLVGANGNVGIGTTSPNMNLDIQSTGNASTRVLRSNGADTRLSSQAGEGVVGTFSNHPLHIKTNQGTRMFVSTGGNVGIGTTNPSNLLDVTTNQGTGYDEGITIRNSSNGWGGSLNFVLQQSGEYKAGQISTSNHSTGGLMRFSTANTSKSLETRMVINNSGNVGIGTTNPSAHLEVNNGAIKISGGSQLSQGRARFQIDTESSTGHKFVEFKNNNGTQVFIDGNGTIEAKKIRVTSTPGADFVFEDDYDLKPLSEVEKFIKKNKHLPEIPPAKEMQKNGLDMSEFQIKLLQKIEEQTLHMISMNKKLEAQQKKINELEAKLEKK